MLLRSRNLPYTEPSAYSHFKMDNETMYAMRQLKDGFQHVEPARLTADALGFLLIIAAFIARKISSV